MRTELIGLVAGFDEGEENKGVKDNSQTFDLKDQMSGWVIYQEGEDERGRTSLEENPRVCSRHVKSEMLKNSWASGLYASLM